MDTRPVPVRARESGIGSASSIVPRESYAHTAGRTQESCTALRPARRNAAILLLLAFLCLFVWPASAQGPVERVELTEVDARAFPVMTLRFRALDAAGRHVPELQRAQVMIQDGETRINDPDDPNPRTAESLLEEAAPLTVHFVVETGISLDDRSWTAAREIIRNFGGWMGEGNTHVAVSLVQGSELVPLIEPTTDANAIANMAHEANPSQGSLAVAMPALTGLLDDMQREAPGQAQAIVFLTRQLESNIGYNTLVARSTELGIPIYTFLLRPSLRPQVAGSNGGTPTPPPLDELVRDLANDTRGQFVLMDDNAATNMRGAFDDLARRGQQYSIVYRVGDNQSGTRTVTLTLPGAAGPVSDSSSYDFAVQPLRVTIDSPTTGAIIDRPAPAEGEAALADPIRVHATVDFGENPARRVLSADLLANGAVVATLDQDQLLSQVNSDTVPLDLFWDMADRIAAEEMAYTLAVRVVDELGESGISESVGVTVRIAPGTTILVDGTPVVVTATPGAPQPTATPIPCFSPSPLCERVERPIRANPVAAISLLVALLALLLAALMWINRGKAPVQRLTQSVQRGIDRLTNRYRRTEVRAYLELLAGDGDVGHRYEIYGDTPIGRSRQNAELLFQQETENSPISRLHCTITDEEDHFMLRDEDSANGTFLNGERLTPVVTYRLKDGDVIELARVERGGVRLRFELATVEDTLPPPNMGYTFVDGQLGGRPDGSPPAADGQGESRF